MVSDEVLMLRFKAGSRESLEQLFARYRVPIHAFFRRRLASRQAAEDLAQETWLAVLRGAEAYEPRALFRTYLYAIALKQVAEARRKSMRQGSAASRIDSQWASSGGQESEQWIREALEKLDPAEREMVMLREYEQLSYQEIAQLLKIPINTVRSRLFRARLALKQLLQPSSIGSTAEGLTAEGRQ